MIDIENRSAVRTRFGRSSICAILLFLGFVTSCISIRFETHLSNEISVAVQLETPPRLSETNTINLTEFLPTRITSTPPITSSPTSLSFTPTRTLSIGSTAVGKDAVTLVYVPAGEFTMGSDDKDIFDTRNHAAHPVHLDAFWIDKTEVTNGMFARCVNAGVCETPRLVGITTPPIPYSDPEYVNHPIEGVSWHDAYTYCSWAGRRLPTEAEWEKAARGTDERAFPWGNDVPTGSEIVNSFNIVRNTTEVGKYPKGESPSGALDMAGNVWEWVADWYSKDFYNISPLSNPVGPNQGQERVIRGGSWNSISTFHLRTWFRSGARPDGSSGIAGVGFRCAVSAIDLPSTLELPTPVSCKENQLAFVSTEDGNEEIFIMDLDGLGKSNLSQNSANDGHPTWSPDGEKVAFHSNRSGDYEIYQMNADGSDVRVLTNSPEWDGQPTWSPDGTRIAFESTRLGRFDIYVMNADGTDVVNLTRGLTGGYPSWSPDGLRLAFQSSGDHGNREIYVMNSDGRNIRRLTFTDSENWMPVWSPDGNTIIFSSNRDGNFELYKMNSDGGEPIRITQNISNEWWPVSFSPNGEKIAFISDRFGSWDVFLMDQDGTNIRRLIDNEVDDQWAVWKPCR